MRVTLGREVVSCLERWKAVPKSACARPGERPEPEIHFESMRVVSTVFRPQRITVVDDFVTKGATLLAAVSRVQAAFPDSSVRGFALVRTRGLVPEVERILDPCVGRITCRGGVVRRDP